MFTCAFGPRANGTQEASEDIFKAKNLSSTPWSTLNNQEHKVVFLTFELGSKYDYAGLLLFFKFLKNIMKLFMR